MISSASNFTLNTRLEIRLPLKIHVIWMGADIVDDHVSQYIDFCVEIIADINPSMQDMPLINSTLLHVKVLSITYTPNAMQWLHTHKPTRPQPDHR